MKYTPAAPPCGILALLFRGNPSVQNTCRLLTVSRHALPENFVDPAQVPVALRFEPVQNLVVYSYASLVSSLILSRLEELIFVDALFIVNRPSCRDRVDYFGVPGATVNENHEEQGQTLGHPDDARVFGGQQGG